MRLFGRLFSTLSEVKMMGSDLEIAAEVAKLLLKHENVWQHSNLKGCVTGASNVVGSRWNIVIFKSKEPLLNADRISELYRPPQEFFEYPVYIRVNNITGSMIVASHSNGIVEAFVQVVARSSLPMLQNRQVYVSRIFDNIAFGEGEEDYRITHLIAQVVGYGNNIETVTLSGYDIGAASGNGYSSLVRSEAMTPRYIGVRLVSQQEEIFRISTTGMIQFSLEENSNLEEFLSYCYSLNALL